MNAAVLPMDEVLGSRVRPTTRARTALEDVVGVLEGQRARDVVPAAGVEAVGGMVNLRGDPGGARVVAGGRVDGGEAETEAAREDEE